MEPRVKHPSSTEAWVGPTYVDLGPETGQRPHGNLQLLGKNVPWGVVAAEHLPVIAPTCRLHELSFLFLSCAVLKIEKV